MALPNRLEVKLTVLFAAVLAGLVLAAAATLLMPKKYLSAATLQIPAAKKIEAEHGILSSAAVLGPVVTACGLPARWGIDETAALHRLRGMLVVRDIRNTGLIQLSILSADPREAAELANAIAIAYQKKCLAEQQAWQTRTLDQFRKEIAGQRRQVEALRARMTELRVKEGIADINPESLSEDNQSPAEAMENLRQKVESLHSAGMGPEHPELMALEAKKTALETLIRQGNSSAPSELAVIQYRKAKQDYLQAKKVLETAEKRLATETMQISSLQNPVTIWERAESPAISSSPRILLNLLAGVLAGLAVGGVAIAVMR